MEENEPVLLLLLILESPQVRYANESSIPHKPGYFFFRGLHITKVGLGVGVRLRMPTPNSADHFPLHVIPGWQLEGTMPSDREGGVPGALEQGRSPFVVPARFHSPHSTPSLYLEPSTSPGLRHRPSP